MAETVTTAPVMPDGIAEEAKEAFLGILKRVVMARDARALQASGADVMQALRYFQPSGTVTRVMRLVAEADKAPPREGPDTIDLLAGEEPELAWSTRALTVPTEAEFEHLLRQPLVGAPRLGVMPRLRPAMAELLNEAGHLTLRHPHAWHRAMVQGMFHRLWEAARSVPGQEAVAEGVAADLAMQICGTPPLRTARALLHGDGAWGSTEMAIALAQALSVREGHAVLHVDCSGYRHDGEAASWVGSKTYWSGSAPGEITSFIYKHPRAVVIFHRIDETLPLVMASLRGALQQGELVDGHGLNEEGRPANLESSSRRAAGGTTLVDCRRAVFLFTASTESDWLLHPQASTILGDTAEQRRANLMQALHGAERMHRGHTTPLFDATVLNELAGHHHVLVPIGWAMLLAQAVAAMPQVLQQAQNALGRPMAWPADELAGQTAEVLASALLLSHGGALALGHTEAQALFKRWMLPLHLERLRAVAMPAAGAAPLHLGLRPRAWAAWDALRSSLGGDPVQTLRRKRKFVHLSFVADAEGWWLDDLELKPVRRLSDYQGAAGLVSQVPSETLNDVSGHEAVKRHLKSVVRQLKQPQRLQAYGVRPPRGVVLYGPPGTGKTLLARALAGEAGLPFISITGTELLDPAAVQRVYAVAHRNEPCVIHVDEADALGCRGKQSAQADAAINLLLAKIDGFEQRSGVFHVLTSNRPEELDPALTRPGRIEHSFEIGHLDRDGRQQYLARLWPLLELTPEALPTARDRILTRCAGMSGAELAQVYGEVVRWLGDAADEMADARAADPATARVPLPQVYAAIDRVRFGERGTTTATEEFRRQVAVHEAGHLLLRTLLLPEHTITLATIAAHRSSAGLVAHTTEGAGRRSETDRRVRSELTILMGGRAAELLYFEEHGPNEGAIADLAKATEVAWRAVAVAGMDAEFGCVSLMALGKQASPALRALAETRVRVWLDEASAAARALLTEHRGTLQALTDALLMHETLDGDQVAAIVATAQGAATRPGPKGATPQARDGGPQRVCP